MMYIAQSRDKNTATEKYKWLFIMENSEQVQYNVINTQSGTAHVLQIQHCQS